MQPFAQWFKLIYLNKKKYPLTFATVLYKSLIKKGRGLWPDEALTTYPFLFFGIKVEKVPNPSQHLLGQISSDTQLRITEK